MVTVSIDPRCNIEYSAFYIQGLYAVYGKKNVTFALTDFAHLEATETLNFVVKTGQQRLNYTIDYSDSSYINQVSYDWCSYYGKINLRRADLPEHMTEKIINLPPGFGIRIWSLAETLLMALRNYGQVMPRPRSLKKFLSGYVKQIRHRPLADYQPAAASPGYIFSVNTLWFSNEWIDTDKTVNSLRLNFYKAVSALPSVWAEVGFVYSQKKNENPLFREYITDRWIPKKKYLRKTQQSVLVFNTPAWDLCHGWKLAEYLALEKAIISTPFYNDLPVPLEHAKHIHFVDGSVDAIRDALQTVLTDAAYRQNLEKQSRLYFIRHGQPEAVLRQLLSKAEPAASLV